MVNNKYHLGRSGGRGRHVAPLDLQRAVGGRSAEDGSQLAAMRHVAQQRLGRVGEDQQGHRIARRADPAAHTLGDGRNEPVVAAGQRHRDTALDERGDFFGQCDGSLHSGHAIGGAARCQLANCHGRTDARFWRSKGGSPASFSLAGCLAVAASGGFGRLNRTVSGTRNWPIAAFDGSSPKGLSSSP